MFKRLGQIVYGIWGGLDLAIALEEFSLDFVDQISFMQYFKDSWVPKIGQMILFCTTYVLICLHHCHLPTAFALFLISLSCCRNVAQINEDSSTCKPGSLWCN